MNRNYFVIIAGIALLCLLLIFVSLWQEIDTPVTKDPITPPNVGPYKTQISGVGIVEPSSENIYISTPINRIVGNVYVKVGEKVQKGETLFSLENQDLLARLELQKADYETALAKVEKLKQFPRQEDLAIAETAVNEAKVNLELAKNQNEMVSRLPDPRAISQEEKNRRQYSLMQAEEKLRQAESNYEKVKAGTWKPDLEIAELEALQAKANLDLARAEIERTVIKSPIDGTVLQVKIHDGELSSSDPFRGSPMIIGNTDELYLRVSINQLDASAFNKQAPAVAYLQGHSKEKFSLSFVRVEPMLVAKQNITNDINEKVDTRVLQIIYRIKNDGRPIYVGQQMDVFIETKRAS